MPARYGIATTRAVAGLLALVGDTQPCTTIEELPTRLRPLPMPIQHLPWPSSVLDGLLLLSADVFTAIEGVQSALFDDHQQAMVRQAALEKLIARYGEHCLWRPALAADHRPECAWA